MLEAVEANSNVVKMQQAIVNSNEGAFLFTSLLKHNLCKAFNVMSLPIESPSDAKLLLLTLLEIAVFF